jgi:pilus assembly protein Flp/PilA
MLWGKFGGVSLGVSLAAVSCGLVPLQNLGLALRWWRSCVKPYFNFWTACEWTRNSLAGALPMANLAKRFWADEKGATAIEYALIASFVSMMVIAGSKSIGTNLATTFSTVAVNITSK